jgi:hypothetical protein
MEAFESGVLDLPDFYFTGDDYRYRFETEAKRRFLGLIRERFNVGVKYNRRVLKWDTVVEEKTTELGRFLLNRTGRLDFAEPTPTLYRMDDQKLRTRILSLSQSEARELGIEKSTLHYLRRKTASERPFKVHDEVYSRIISTGRGSDY